MQATSKEALPRTLWLGTALVLIVAAFPLPYGYYTFARIVTCLACALLAYCAYRNTPPAVLWTSAFALLAVLFNPAIPIHLTKMIWIVLDVGAAAVVLAHLAIVRGIRP
jgi:hypothetical protein